MTLEEYEKTIRPALAEFCGWDEQGEGLSIAPNGSETMSVFDPLYNPADAWALETALIDSGRSVRFYTYYTKPDGYGCNIGECLEIQRADTRERALILAAWEIVRQTAERPSGE